jgi:hypothetical protein
VLCRLVRSSQWMSDPPYCNSLHYFLTCHTLVSLRTPTPVKWREFQWGKHVCLAHKKPKHEANLFAGPFPMSLPLLHLSHQECQNDWSLRHLLHVNPNTSATSYRKTQTWRPHRWLRLPVVLTYFETTASAQHISDFTIT